MAQPKKSFEFIVTPTTTETSAAAGGATQRRAVKDSTVALALPIAPKRHRISASATATKKEPPTETFVPPAVGPSEGHSRHQADARGGETSLL